MNKVIISGRFVKDPDEYATTDGKKIAKYTLAVARNGNREVTDFISFVAYDKRAEFVLKYCRKGMKIMVEGELITGSYTNKDGIKVYTKDVRAVAHEFCESKKEEQKESRDDGWMLVPDGVEDEGLPFN